MEALIATLVTVLIASMIGADCLRDWADRQMKWMGEQPREENRQ